VVKKLPETGKVDANSKDNFGPTPPSFATKNGGETVAKVLLSIDGVDPDSKDNYNRTPLIWASVCGKDALVKILLGQNCVYLNQKDKFGRTALFAAAVRGHEIVVKLLLDKDGIEPNVVDIYGRTAQIDAIRMGYLHTAQLFHHKQTDGVEDDENGIRGPRQDTAHGRIFCSVCLAVIPDSDFHHHCATCDYGDFDACQDCIGRGAFCSDRSHLLIKRRVKDSVLVEI
jgi:hypothetical protein